MEQFLVDKHTHIDNIHKHPQHPGRNMLTAGPVGCQQANWMTSLWKDSHVKQSQILYRPRRCNRLSSLPTLALLQSVNSMRITILTPVLATFWGVFFNHEPLSSHLIIGLIFLCLGLSLYAYRNKARVL